MPLADASLLLRVALSRYESPHASSSICKEYFAFEPLARVLSHRS
jgi:hypothetical protein